MKNKFNRRKFIKTSLLGGLGVTALGANALANINQIDLPEPIFHSMPTPLSERWRNNCVLDL
jgi:hypothetical protein